MNTQIETVQAHQENLQKIMESILNSKQIEMKF